MSNSLGIFSLEGRKALVTGGAKGLGRAMAEALAGAGADLFLTGRNKPDLDAAVDQIRQATGRAVFGFAADVTDSDQVKAMVAEAIARLGHLDILVNNAGMNTRGPITELTEEQWSELQATNLTGPWLCCRAVGPHMMARRYGRIINLGSMLSSVALPDRTLYCSSKGGVLQLTRALALEWAPYGITVNCLCPGPFETPLNRQLLENPEVRQAFTSKIPLGRWGQPEELAGPILFLASEASSFVTGSALYVDGGWTAQ